MSRPKVLLMGRSISAISGPNKLMIRSNALCKGYILFQSITLCRYRRGHIQQLGGAREGFRDKVYGGESDLPMSSTWEYMGKFGRRVLQANPSFMQGCVTP